MAEVGVERRRSEGQTAKRDQVAARRLFDASARVGATDVAEAVVSQQDRVAAQPLDRRALASGVFELSLGADDNHFRSLRRA